MQVLFTFSILKVLIFESFNNWLVFKLIPILHDIKRHRLVSFVTPFTICGSISPQLRVWILMYLVQHIWIKNICASMSTLCSAFYSYTVRVSRLWQSKVLDWILFELWNQMRCWIVNALSALGILHANCRLFHLIATRHSLLMKL